MENRKNERIEEESKELMQEYNAQAESEDIHFEHVDWTYSDGSGCCC